MILADASVLIDLLRQRDPKLKSLFSSLSVAVCGVTRAELLHGARSARDRKKIVTLLDGLQQVLHCRHRLGRSRRQSCCTS